MLFSASVFSQHSVLLWRVYQCTARDPILFVPKYHLFNNDYNNVYSVCG
jgi:hypothetical protein